MFLRDVSNDLLRRFSHNLSSVTVVFPGKRARLFMNQYLAEACDKPIWAPKYKTIDELYSELSSYGKIDTMVAVCKLYSIYASIVPDAEPLDEFYGWGEIILSDFDDIDKHMAPASKIFHNVYDLQSISTDYLTEDQVTALQEFFKNFSIENNTIIKERFLRLWSIMPELYDRLRRLLMQEGTLYSGALYREVAERIRRNEVISDENSSTTYVFVGFNILDECEETLFRFYQQQHRALFYWDYDKLYTSDPMWEAGYFINQNLRNFENALPAEQFDNLSHLKGITFIATSTNNAQCRHIPTWLSQQLTDRESETAIVLADEHMLGSVLHSISDQPQSINVTMGFPLVDTPVFSFLNVLMSLFIDGYDTAAKNYRYTFMERVRRHPYYKYVADTTLFEPVMIDSVQLLERLILTVDTISTHYASKAQPDVYDQLYTEALFQTHLTLTRFHHLCLPDEHQHNPILRVHTTTLRRLLKQIFSTTNIPFHGEPAIGLQIMGLLETRNLDFRHLLMLNVGEGILPKKNDDNSLIPYALRESFGLTTIRHKISVFAYYFYRLISRAEHVTLLYNENTSGGTTNEMSRFMRQLMSETDLPIRYVRLMPSNNPTSTPLPRIVQKSPEMAAKLSEKYINNSHHYLSPTAINTYLGCPLKYYFKYVAGISIPDKTEDGIGAAMLGNIFHDAAHLFYLFLQHKHDTKTITAKILEPFLEDVTLNVAPFINLSFIFNAFQPIKDQEEKEQAIKRYAQESLQRLRDHVAKFFSNPANESFLTGINHIIHRVLLQYFTQLLAYDKHHAPFTLVALEKDFYLDVELSPGQVVRTGGRVDRIEIDQNGRLTVVDYKTSGHLLPISNLETVFKMEKPYCKHFVQTFIYSHAVSCASGNNPVCPTLFFPNHAARPSEYDRRLYFGTEKRNQPIENVLDFSEEFLSRLRQTISDICSPDLSFSAKESDKSCQYCDYRKLCCSR